MDSIKAIQGLNIFKVNPVKFDEQNRYEKNAEKNLTNKFGNFNPNHPNMRTSFRANNLDMMA